MWILLKRTFLFGCCDLTLCSEAEALPEYLEPAPEPAELADVQLFCSNVVAAQPAEDEPDNLLRPDTELLPNDRLPADFMLWSLVVLESQYLYHDACDDSPPS
jgi:hypothetical protein